MGEIANKEVIEIVKRYIEELQKHIKIDKIILFGSYAKNKEDEYSDIDIAIVSNDFTGNIEEDFILLMKVSKEVDLRIEPHPFLTREFEEDPFAEEIVKTGIEVYAA